MNSRAFENPRVIVPPPLIFAGLLAVGLWLDRENRTGNLVRISGSVGP